MPKKISTAVTSSGAAASVPQATPTSDGKSYIRNPKNPSQLLQIQSKEGNQFRCFPVVSGGPNPIVDSKTTVYVSEEYEAQMEKI